MESIFLKLLNISIMASWLVGAILLVRILIKKAPKWFYCALWGIVGLRLIFPFSFESMFSLIPSSTTIDTTINHARPTIQTGFQVVDQNVNEYIASTYYEGVTVETNTFSNVINTISIIWIIGMIAMLVYSIYSYYKVANKVNASIQYRENIYLCDDLNSPFILGIFNPKIYLPSYLDEKQMMYVLQHEQAHLKRKDHYYKPLGFALLSIYWFNPILWIAYSMLCKDIEAACDEKVIKEMNNHSKKEYSETLFECSVSRNLIMACPLAFGEVGVKERIKSILNYKKPSFWILIASIVLCVCFSICFLTIPKANSILDIENHTALFNEVSDIQFVLDSENIEISHQDDVNEVLDLLLNIKIKQNPISQNRSEDREKTHQINCIYNNNLNNLISLNFSDDYSSIWIDDGVKPTLSYKVKNPALVKEIFETVYSNENKVVVESLNAVVKEINDSMMDVQSLESDDCYQVNVESIDKKILHELKTDDKIQIVYSGNIYQQEKIIQDVHAIYYLNQEDTLESLDSFISNTILNYNSYSLHSGSLHFESHEVLSTEIQTSLTGDDEIIKEYLAVYYQEFNIENNELVEVSSKYIPTIISYKIIDNEYILQDYWTSTSDEFSKEIHEMFPGESANDVLNQSKCIDQLKDSNQQKAQNYLDKIIAITNREEVVQEIINTINKYDNGYTNEDYMAAKGEKCLHPRIQYESDVLKLRIEIWADPHRLFCYLVKIYDLNEATCKIVYIDTNNYDSIQQDLEKFDLVQSYM